MKKFITACLCLAVLASATTAAAQVKGCVKRTGEFNFVQSPTNPTYPKWQINCNPGEFAHLAKWEARSVDNDSTCGNGNKAGVGTYTWSDFVQPYIADASEMYFVGVGNKWEYKLCDWDPSAGGLVSGSVEYYNKITLTCCPVLK